MADTFHLAEQCCCPCLDERINVACAAALSLLCRIVAFNVSGLPAAATP
jgi:hypothetical protein